MTYLAIVIPSKEMRILPTPKSSVLSERLSLTECSALRAERAVAYSLLERAHLDFFGAPLPEVRFFADGKPYLYGSPLHISLSHTDSACAVSFSQNGTGVDAQSYSSVVGKERVIERFVNKTVQNNINKAKSPEIKLLVYRANFEGELELYSNEPPSITEAPLLPEAEVARVWSCAEALLKVGHGFSDIKKLSEISSGACIESLYTADAVISVAELARTPRASL